MRVLVLGATGMLGSAVYYTLGKDMRYETIGTARNGEMAALLPKGQNCGLYLGVDVNSSESLSALFKEIRPQVVINCVGIIKQIAASQDPCTAIEINALLPHRLHHYCSLYDARLLQISTDCVFSGSKGHYLETDLGDATDLYGRTKLLGEVVAPNAITLRTSIIGHELNGGAHGLIGWFLSQTGSVNGFQKAIFSGLPTTTLAEIMADYILPNPSLSGLYHVAAAPIDKLSLLSLVREVYGKDIHIRPSGDLVIDRSLSGDKFSSATGYQVPGWPALIAYMHASSHIWTASASEFAANGGH